MTYLDLILVIACGYGIGYPLGRVIDRWVYGLQMSWSCRRIKALHDETMAEVHEHV